MPQAPEMQGGDIVYAIVLPPSETGESSEQLKRVYNQNTGTYTIESESTELNTKDKTGSGYGANTETVSFEGVHTEGDMTMPYIKKAIRQHIFVEIVEINLRTKRGERGLFQLSNYEKSSENGSNLTYSVEATLNGEMRDIEIENIPEGAPDHSPGNDSDDESGSGSETQTQTIDLGEAE